MTKRKILLLIPLAIIAGFIIYSWIIVFTTNYALTWRHISAPVLFMAPVFLYFQNFSKAVVATGVYLIIGIANGFTLTPAIISTSFGIGPLETPAFQPLSMELLILFVVLNYVTLVNIYLDYKESKTKPGTPG